MPGQCTVCSTVVDDDNNCSRGSDYLCFNCFKLKAESNRTLGFDTSDTTKRRAFIRPNAGVGVIIGPLIMALSGLFLIVNLVGGDFIPRLLFIFIGGLLYFLFDARR